jgi:hypothetical protein
MRLFPGWTLPDVCALTLPQFLRITEEIAALTSDTAGAGRGASPQRDAASSVADRWGGPVRVRSKTYRARDLDDGAELLTHFLSGGTTETCGHESER